MNFISREIVLLAQDFENWRGRMARRRRGIADLLADRPTVERQEVAPYVRITLALIVAFAFLYIVGGFVPVGFDWKCCFSTGNLASFFVPWMLSIVRLFNPQSIFALTVLALIMRMWRYKARPWQIFLALTSLPTLWLLFLGNVDGLVMVGLLLLPVLGVPLVLIKPQIASFSLLANRRSISAAIVWVILSILIWGFWPLNFLPVGNAQWRADWPQDITLYPWGVLLMLPLLWLSRGDEDMLMVAGSFATPHLFPYHFYVVMPALARMGVFWAVLSWAVSFTPFLANYWGPAAWHFGNLLSVTLWLGLYQHKRSLERLRKAEYEPTGVS